MKRLSQMHHKHNIAPNFMTKVWCYVPISDGSLGVAVANEKGYTPVPKYFAYFETYDLASAECDKINRAFLRLNDETAIWIISSTMVTHHRPCGEPVT